MSLNVVKLEQDTLCVNFAALDNLEIVVLSFPHPCYLCLKEVQNGKRFKNILQSNPWRYPSYSKTRQLMFCKKFTIHAIFILFCQNWNQLQVFLMHNLHGSDSCTYTLG